MTIRNEATKPRSVTLGSCCVPKDAASFYVFFIDAPWVATSGARGVLCITDAVMRLVADHLPEAHKSGPNRNRSTRSRPRTGIDGSSGLLSAPG